MAGHRTGDHCKKCGQIKEEERNLYKVKMKTLYGQRERSTCNEQRGLESVQNVQYVIEFLALGVHGRRAISCIFGHAPPTPHARNTTKNKAELPSSGASN